MPFEAFFAEPPTDSGQHIVSPRVESPLKYLHDLEGSTVYGVMSPTDLQESDRGTGSSTPKGRSSSYTA